MKEYTIKDFVMNDKRLKNGDSILTENYLGELFKKSEKEDFYQTVTEIYVISIDYDRNSKTDIYKMINHYLKKKKIIIRGEEKIEKGSD